MEIIWKIIAKIIEMSNIVIAFVKSMSVRQRIIAGAAALVVLILLIVVFSGPDDTKVTMSTVAEAVRGDFTIAVTEEGNLKSMDTIDIKCEVERGGITIVSIIEEGTYITDQDVADSKILIKLDSSKLEEDLDRERISLRSAEAAFNQADKELEIQKKQNESDINTARLKVKFNRMDLDKYLGSELAEKAVNDTVTYAEQINDEALGGEAKQNKLKFEGEIDIAKAEVSRAEKKLTNVLEMEKEGFVSPSDVEFAELDYKRTTNSVLQQEIALDLFTNYEFPKTAEERVSNYTEAINEHERTRDRANAKLVKTQIDRDSKEATYKIKTEQVDKLVDQIAKCTIRATSPGLVTYAHRRREDPPKEGGPVRNQQKLLTIPNLAKMGVEVMIQESHINKIKDGQPANIKLEAFPDRPLKGKVVKIGIMPDSQNRWLSPDVKVYKVEVEIEGEHDFIKPGMSCEVEVVVGEIKDVIMVPIQAVMLHEGKKLCIVASSTPELREVEPGDYNDEFVEIRKGLKKGEKVLLYKPENMPAKLVQLPESKKE
jgi:HlyD family secretion protein